MNRSLASPALVVLLASVARAQADMRARLAPITSPIRHAGVYHVATGTWTRGATLSNLTGPDTIYNNTCAQVYFTGLVGNERPAHRSRIPSTTGPTTDSVFYGTTDSNHRYDERHHSRSNGRARRDSRRLWPECRCVVRLALIDGQP